MTRRFLTAEWRHLLMLNYEIDPAALRPLAPRGTEIDSWNGKTFLSVVGFLFQNTRVLGFPVPLHRNFEEINLRIYVRRQASAGWRRGVVFVKEIVPKIAIAAVARWIYNENYVAHPMRSRVQLPDPSKETRGLVEYGWTSRGAATAFARSSTAHRPCRRRGRKKNSLRSIIGATWCSGTGRPWSTAWSIRRGACGGRRPRSSTATWRRTTAGTMLRR